MRIAGLSIDVDSVASHLAGYGYDREEAGGEAYTLAIPRALDMFGREGVRATFFLIAREAEHHPAVVRRIVAEGHEVASHSLTHRLPFASLSAEDLLLETAESRSLLQEISGVRVSGFRAPSWDLSQELLGAVVDAGYRYDASTYPSILLPLLRLSVARRSPRGRSQAGASAWSGVFGPGRPHPLKHENGILWEIPICTDPLFRLPYYHTPRLVFPRPVSSAVRRLVNIRRGPITYVFHAVDFLGLEEDGLDSRIRPHPGMDLPLHRKLSLVHEALGNLAAGRQVVALDRLVDGLDREIPAPERSIQAA